MLQGELVMAKSIGVAIIGSKSAILLQRRPVDLEFQVEGVAPPTILLLRKLG